VWQAKGKICKTAKQDWKNRNVAENIEGNLFGVTQYRVTPSLH
jgi:hypothetical protein